MTTPLPGAPLFGATLSARERTAFRLWAPDAEQVSVVLDGGAPVAMQQTGDGWFAAEAPCGAGTRYRFQLAGGQMVPDPASRAQDGGVHGWSVVVDPGAYRWRHDGWRGRPWGETVLYELNVGVLGGFAGVEAILPYLADLGVTAVELMPIAEFPGSRNWGYDGVLPFAPQSSYGSPDELKRLVDRAHELGLTMFLDVVYNHFGPDGNYLSLYASPFFRSDLQTPWGPAIDFRRAEVREFFIRNAVYWLGEYRFDGLRLDAVHAISERDFLIELAGRVREASGPDRHVHLVLENDENDAELLESSFDAQWNDDFHHVLHVLLTGEQDNYYRDYAVEPAGKLARAVAGGFVFQGEPALMRKGEPRGSPSRHLPPSAFVNFLQNHDQIGNRAFGERISLLADPAAIRAARALILLSPQIPMLFMGEEFGSTEPFLYFTSHTDPRLAEAVREGRRREFGGFAAFSEPQARARIPDPNDPQSFGASRFDLPDAGDPELAFTKALLRARRGIAGPLAGAMSLGAEVLGPAAVSAAWTLGDGSRLRIAVNLGGEPVAAPAPSPTADIVIETPAGAAAHMQGGVLPPRAAVVWQESCS